MNPLTAIRFSLIAVVAALASLAAAGAVGAAPSCAKTVIADWYDNGRIDGTYDIHCYRDAIDALPEDVRTYGTAKEEIERALTDRPSGQQNPPPPPASPAPSPPAQPSPSASPPPPPSPPPNKPEPTEQPPGEAVPTAATTSSSPSSVPLPIVVLGGLAAVLLVAGSAGYVMRRLQARRGGPPAV